MIALTLPLPLLVLLTLLGTSQAPTDDLACRLRLIDGCEVTGSLIRLSADRISLEGRDRPVSYHELHDLVFEGRGTTTEGSGESVDPDSRAFVRFASGEDLPGRIIGTDGETFRLLVRGRKTPDSPAGESLGEIAIPLTALRAFRLREPHPRDHIFEETLESPAPEKDVVFIRRDNRLLRIECVFRGLDDERVTVEYGGQERRIRRPRVMGVILSTVARTEVERSEEGTLWLRGGGRVPALLRGVTFRRDDRSVEWPQLAVEIHGVPWKVDLRHLERVTFASDRIRFLSDQKPTRVREVPFFDRVVLPYRTDRSVGGGALRLGGVEYSKGLGVHSRSTLEYVLDDAYASLVARVGIDDVVGRQGNATIRVLGNGRTLYEGKVAGGDEPLDVVVSILGIRTLTLETDYGEDGVDLGDHVDWANVRLVKSRTSEKSEVTK